MSKARMPSASGITLDGGGGAGWMAVPLNEVGGVKPSLYTAADEKLPMQTQAVSPPKRQGGPLSVPAILATN
jgi:hypothetical protein